MVLLSAEFRVFLYDFVGFGLRLGFRRIRSSGFLGRRRHLCDRFLRNRRRGRNGLMHALQNDQHFFYPIRGAAKIQPDSFHALARGDRHRRSDRKTLGEDAVLA